MVGELSVKICHLLYVATINAYKIRYTRLRLLLLPHLIDNACVYSIWVHKVMRNTRKCRKSVGQGNESLLHPLEEVPELQLRV